MANQKAWIEDHCAATGETLEAFVVGNGDWGGGPDAEVAESERGTIIDAGRLSILDYESDSGIGSVQSHAVYVWTDRSVGFVVTDGGLERMHWVPRSPTDVMPEMLGR